MNIVKIVVAIGIFCCLFLPLSHCSTSQERTSIETETSSEIETKTSREDGDSYSILHWGNLTDIDNFPLLLGFLLPFLFCIKFNSKKTRIVMLILQTANCVYLVLLTYISVYVFHPLWGGYLLTTWVILNFVHTFYEWIILFRNRIAYQNTSNH